MKKFTSIGSLAQVISQIKYRANAAGLDLAEVEPIPFCGTVKIHGTNVGVRIEPDGNITFQSRERTLSQTEDHYGWFAFGASRSDGAWMELVRTALEINNIQTQTDAITIYGEWCGTKIQNKVAVAQCPRHFVIFGIAHGDTMLNNIVGMHKMQESIYNITQVPTYRVTLNLKNLNEFQERVTEITREVEARCPWAFFAFNVEGTGEGVVWVPEGRAYDTSLYFKTKGEAHKVRSNPKGDIAPIDFEKLDTINEYVDVVVTEGRMEQMIFDHNIQYSSEYIGRFIQLVTADILKEESDLLHHNNITWKEVCKPIQRKARDWFTNRITRSIMDA